MEWMYAILGLILVALTNIISTTVIADRYEFDSDDKITFIVWSSVVAIFITGCIGVLDINLSFLGIYAALIDVLFWVISLVGLNAAWNFSKLLPAISRICNGFIDKLLNIKSLFVRRARQKIVIELHKDEEIARLKASLEALELKLNQGLPSNAITMVEARPKALVINGGACPVKVKRSRR